MYRIDLIVILSLLFFCGGCHTSKTKISESSDTNSSGEQNSDSVTDEHPGSHVDTDSETDTETGSELCENFDIDGGTCPEYPPWDDPCEQECQMCEYGYLDDGCGGVTFLCLENQWIEHYHTDPGPECDDAGSGV